MSAASCLTEGCFLCKINPGILPSSCCYFGLTAGHLSTEVTADYLPRLKQHTETHTSWWTVEHSATNEQMKFIRRGNTGLYDMIYVSIVFENEQFHQMCPHLHKQFTVIKVSIFSNSSSLNCSEKTVLSSCCSKNTLYPSICPTELTVRFTHTRLSDFILCYICFALHIPHGSGQLFVLLCVCSRHLVCGFSDQMQ